MKIWQYLVCQVVKKRERTALLKSAHQLCSRMVRADLNSCYVQFSVCVMCILPFVLCAVVSLWDVQSLGCAMCRF